MGQPTFSFYTLILMISVVGAVNGWAAGVLLRRRWWLLWGLAGMGLAYGAEEMYSWYRLGYTEAGPAVTALAYASCGWIVANALAVLLLVPAALLSLWRRLRRATQWIGLGWAGLALCIGLWGVTAGAMERDVHTVDIEAEGIPSSFDGWRIAQISDTHIGPYYAAADLDRDLAEAAAQGADLAAITGDLIDDNRFMGETAAVLAKWKSHFPEGMVYIWGNHEYYHDRSEVRAGLAGAGIPILENEVLPLRRGEDTLYIAGVDYPWARGDARKAEAAEMAGAAFSHIPAGAPAVLIAHHPDFLDEGFRRGAVLMLAGHTHGVQLGLFGRPVITPFTYTRGLYSDGEHTGYVNRGNGGWFPFRFGCSREMAFFVLHAK